MSVPLSLPYAEPINRAAFVQQASPPALWAIACRETIMGEFTGWLASVYPGKTAATVISEDDGRGLFQLTSSFPDDWSDPQENAEFAAAQFYDPYLKHFLDQGLTGDVLLKLTADAFNAGTVATDRWHAIGNADGATTGRDYGRDVLAIYHAILAGATTMQEVEAARRRERSDT